MLSKRMVLTLFYCFISYVAGDYDDEEKSKYFNDLHNNDIGNSFY